MNKLTPDYVNSIIDHEFYIIPSEDSPSTLTICVMTLKNGFEVIGQSACCSREIYNEEVGKIEARKKAVDKIWPLEGYLLKERMLYANSQKEPRTKAAPVEPPEPVTVEAIDDDDLEAAANLIEDIKQKPGNVIEETMTVKKDGKITEVITDPKKIKEITNELMESEASITKRSFTEPEPKTA